jgi:hypothetical protein
MPQYAIIGDHTPLTCPGASKSAAKHAEDALGKRMPELAQKLGVQVQQMLHLDPSHKTFVLVEAPNAEAVRDVLFEGGFIAFNNIEFYLVTPVTELIQRSADWEKPFS